MAMKTERKIYQAYIAVEDFDTGEHTTIDQIEVEYDRELVKDWTEEDIRKAMIEEFVKDEEDRIDPLSYYMDGDEEDEVFNQLYEEYFGECDRLFREYSA